ncbi:unnamed protein product [Rotaria magnacalcarata]|uniref:Uncharacterized protein n=1 Tax=Rotaria magnacalcarata TaxID=392030 RepID=A0A814W5Z0_9BILA|nr:unnamed protein product [Rotaria magnacalcarata]CAF1681103.1 unnamed protein product [Rotaria magnacalcarata]CAF2035861.1 unnamed protein product [Rotaria magnacalcarata]CAF3810353.1 unnamed protein product [Rotaria magnacalcarata]CAF3940903.1 unnamed protein product [Rotaria magnacalcarata]
MSTSQSSSPPVDNRFKFDWPPVYTRCIEPIFDWNHFRRSQLQYKLAESLHESHVYDRCNCSVVRSKDDSSPCLAHAANRFSQIKIDGSVSPLLACPCMFCRKHFSEKDRPEGLPSIKNLKQLLPTRGFMNSKPSPPTMVYLSRPHTVPSFHATFPLDHTFATRYVPTFKRISRPNGVREEIFDVQQTVISKSAIPTQLGMRLDAEPNHDHTQVLDLPPQRDSFFRSVDDYFNMTPGGGSTMLSGI